MTLFKSLVTSKSFADLVYEDYVQNKQEIKKPQVHLTIVRTPKMPEAKPSVKQQHLSLSASLTFSPLKAQLSCNTVSAIEPQQPAAKRMRLVSHPLALHIEQLTVLDNFTTFVEKKLQNDFISFVK